MIGHPVIPGYDEFVKLGEGGQAAVYRARQSTLDGIEVAVKVYKAEVYDADVRRFRREVEALQALRDEPHVVRLLKADFTSDEDGRDNGHRPYVVMPLYHTSMRDRLRQGPLTLHHALTVGAHIAGALDAAHRCAHSIVHGDVKPGNILVSLRGEVALADFGIVKIRRPDGHVTGTWAQTLAYAAPEVRQGGQPTERSDVYSLGLTICELIAGPSSGADVPRPAGLGLPREVARILAEATDEAPERRFPGTDAPAAEFARALEQAARRLTATQPTELDPHRTAVEPEPTRIRVRHETVPEPDRHQRDRALLMGSAWLVTGAVLSMVGWPLLFVPALLFGLLPLMVWFVGNEAAAVRIAWATVAWYVIGALAVLLGMADSPGRRVALLVLVTVALIEYVVAAVSAQRWLRARDDAAQTRHRNAVRAEWFTRFEADRARRERHVRPTWLLEALNTPAARIFERTDRTFPYAIACDREVIFVDVTEWRTGTYRIDGVTVFNGSSHNVAYSSDLEVRLEEGERLSTSVRAAQARVLLVVDGRGRGDRIVLDPIVRRGPYQVVTATDADLCIKGLLARAEPGMVDVEVLEELTASGWEPGRP